MTRTIDTSRRKIQEIAETSDNFGRIIRASLAEDYSGIGTTVRIRMGRTSSAQTIQARISTLTGLSTSYPEGSPVSIKFRRGKAELISFGSTELITVRTILEKVGVADSMVNGLSSPQIVVFSAAQVLVDTHDLFTDTDDSITIPFNGTYHVWGYQEWASDFGSRRLYIYLNGVQKWIISSGSPDDATGSHISAVQGVNISVTYPFDEDDVLTMYAAQNSGSSMNLTEAMFGIELVH